MEWKVDYNKLIPFLGRTIYKTENVLVELGANCYDADSSMVEMVTKGDSQQILIKDNGCGMNFDDLEDLITVAKSKKKEMVDKNRTTKKFNRKLLGSFGIGIISFFALGDFIKIFTLKEGNKPIFMEIKKIFDEEHKKLIDIYISDPIESEEYSQHLIDKQHGTTIEINNNTLNLKDTNQYQLVKYKLSNLPLSENFKIKLNDVEIKKDDFLDDDWIKKQFEFVLDHIDPEYKSKCNLYVNRRGIVEEKYKRGIYLVVNGRVIEKDLFSEVYPDLSSPGSISARVRGFIQADYLTKYIQANREDFFDIDIIKAIKDKIKNPINQMIEDYKIQKRTDEKDEKYNELLQRIQNAQNKFEAPNRYLKELGINFASIPGYEPELVLIISQMCQKGYLPFQILDYNSNSHIDCIVQWPMEQTKRYPKFMSELEVEISLECFFKHNHDFRTKPDICCWKINEANFEKEKKKYIKNRPESVESIELKDGKDKEHYGHQRELHFKINYDFNEQKTYILRIYVISEIIKALCSVKD